MAKFLLFFLMYLSITPFVKAAVDISLVHDAKTMNDDDIAVVSSTKRIAWTTQKKPSDSYFDPTAERLNPTTFPYFLKGATISISDDTGANPIEITSHETNNMFPSWSNDGNMLAYISENKGSIELWVYDVTKQKARKVVGFN